ncbi:MAG: PilZ domain-containing protein [Phycisphaerales bacterium]|nr:MAG: PilZ domain-containing protein [Phycisphaerales bacterium]
MRFDPKAGVVRPIIQRDTRRRRGRLGQEGLTSSHGPVLDLSSGGARVMCRRVPKGAVILELVGAGGVFRLKAHVAWSRKIGLFKYEVGFEFDDVPPDVARKLTTLATDHRTRRAV